MISISADTQTRRPALRAATVLTATVVASAALATGGFAAKSHVQNSRVTASTLVNCADGGSLPFRWGAVRKRPRVAQDGRTKAAAALREYIRAEQKFEEVPRRGWFELGRAQGVGNRRYIEFGVGRLTNLSTVSFERRGRGPWSYDGSSYFGTCVPRVMSPNGVPAVEWFVDPARPPLDPSDTVLHLGRIRSRLCQWHVRRRKGEGHINITDAGVDRVGA